MPINLGSLVKKFKIAQDRKAQAVIDDAKRATGIMKNPKKRRAPQKNPSIQEDNFAKKHTTPNWLPRYVADCFSKRDGNNIWEHCEDYNIIRNVWRANTKTEDHRKNIIKTLYYKHHIGLTNQADGMVMIPNRLLHSSLKWGSIAIASYPGSDIYLYFRGNIEEFTSKNRETGYLREAPSHYNKGKHFKYWMIPREELKLIIIPGVPILPNMGIKDYHLRDIP